MSEEERVRGLEIDSQIVSSTNIIYYDLNYRLYLNKYIIYYLIRLSIKVLIYLYFYTEKNIYTDKNS